MKKLMSTRELSRKIDYNRKDCCPYLYKDVFDLHFYASVGRNISHIEKIAGLKLRKIIELGEGFGSLLVVETSEGSCIVPTDVNFPPYYGGSLKQYINTAKEEMVDTLDHYEKLRAVDMKKQFFKVASLGGAKKSKKRREVERLFRLAK